MRFCQSRKRISREKTCPTTRVSRNQTKVVRAAPVRRHRPPYENCTACLPAPLNPSRRVARKENTTLPCSRLRCARWTSINYHQSRPRSTKHTRPRNDQISSARKKEIGRETPAPGREVLPRPKELTVLGTKSLFKRKIGKDGRTE